MKNQKPFAIRGNLPYNSCVMRLKNKIHQKYKNKASGFTIVELLLVIVVIGILAAIVITAYINIMARAHDTAIKTDLSNIAKKVKMYRVENDVYPAGSDQLATLDIEVNKGSYGNHMDNGWTFNLVYCRMPAAEPTEFALVAFSKSDKDFMYSNSGEFKEYTGGKSSSGEICTAAGVPMAGHEPERDWFFHAGSWQSYVGG